jgi:hypothetical protein
MGFLLVVRQQDARMLRTHDEKRLRDAAGTFQRSFTNRCAERENGAHRSARRRHLWRASLRAPRTVQYAPEPMRVFETPKRSDALSVCVVRSPCAMTSSASSAKPRESKRVAPTVSERANPPLESLTPS